ncbi:hypothetical protein K470DRAFT_166911 [Piedraia hortae CBS 480.64]|uniref:Casein kinase II subunit beta n=1 Tax=Piedraia hortae CBS 480.64 TaxID=1314780 RepID=A0A6A7C806_9PEZI|nr:hypothetical protein K470DRAFT_166911 [Piedraia hortae CBS 480.64]
MSSTSQAPESWITAFCSLVGHEYFAEVSEDFIEDDFNLTGLSSQVPMYKEALEMILDVEPEDVSDVSSEEEDDDQDEELSLSDDSLQQHGQRYRRVTAQERRHLRMTSDISMIESAAEMLYGLIHQRFITSRQGIQQMAEKYDLGHFGHCPRVNCNAAKVLPVGCSDVPGQETVKLFCPSCLDVYTPPNSRFQAVDGAFFGTTFGCLFLMTFPEIEVGGRLASQTEGKKETLALPPIPAKQQQKQQQSSSSSAAAAAASTTVNGLNSKNLAPGLGEGHIYEPRIYGFRISELAKTGPRMRWLRSKPKDVSELDETTHYEESKESSGMNGVSPT